MICNRTKLLTQLRSGVIGRRDFLAAAAALGISAATAHRALADAPQRGGHLIIGCSAAGTQDSFDPATWGGDWMQHTGPIFYDTLTMANERLELVPMLAESWEPKPGVKEWVFKLRRGVTFHNGKPLTPADVIYSLNHHRGPDSKSMAKSLFAGIDDIKETASNEVTFYLASGNADLPYMFSDGRAAIAPEGSKFDGIGTGAYVLEFFEPGLRATGKRFNNDWNSQRGWVESVEVLAINDTTARMSALLSGGAHLVNKLPPVSADQLRQNPSVQVFSIAGSSHSTFSMRCDVPPFNNLDLRLAMKYAIDREAIVKTVFRGFGLVGNDQPIPPSYPFYASDIPQRTYDPDKTRFHLKKSGHSGPVTLVTADVVYAGAVEASQIFQASAKKAGLDIQINRVPNDGYSARLVADNISVFSSAWGGKPTSDLLFALEFGYNSPINETRWRNEKFNDLLIASRAELDKTKRAQMYHDLELLVRDDGGTIIPIYTATIDGAAKNLRGFIPSPVQQMMGYRAAQFVWFAS